MVKREIKHLRKISKLIVPRETHKRIGKIKDKIDRIDLYKHSIRSNLEIRIHNLEKGIKNLEGKHDVFYLLTKAKLLNLKIKYFYITHEKKDLKESLKIIKEIEGELKEFAKIS